MSGRDNDILAFLGETNPPLSGASIHRSRGRARYEALYRVLSLGTSWSSDPAESPANLYAPLCASIPAYLVWKGSPYTTVESDARDSIVAPSSQVLGHLSSFRRYEPGIQTSSFPSDKRNTMSANQKGWITSVPYQPWPISSEDDSTHCSPDNATSVYKSASSDIDELAFRLSGIRVGTPRFSADRKPTYGNRIFPQSLHEEQHPALFLERIISDTSIPILMLGEGSQLSMTIALAFMRASFNGVWSSSYTHGTRQFSKAHIATLINSQRQRVGRLEWSSKYKNASATHLRDEDIPKLGLEIDARELGAAVMLYPDVPMHVLWFPFPWAMRTTDILLRDLIASAASVQRKLAVGGVLIIGLTLYQPYASFYGDLDQLVQYARWLGYEHYAEHDFMKTTCCQFGYQHWWSGVDDGMPPVHVKVIDPSSTHIFVMRPTMV